MHFLDSVLVPMHPEGRKFVAIFAVSTLVLALLWGPLFFLGLVLTIWCYYFFRDPVRMVPQDKQLIIAPADGVVTSIMDCVPPADMELGEEPLTRVSIFMNVFNCHVNRASVDGKVVAINYHSGKFINASLDKASEHNERNSVTLENADGTRLGIVQIAGLVARRIVCFVKVGDELETGDRFGLIRFGSRLDVYLPPSAKPLVLLGQTSVAGETVLASTAKSQKAMTGEAK